MTLTATQTTATDNRSLVLEAFAALGSSERVDASRLYAADVEFLGPGRAVWTESALNSGHSQMSDECVEIERIEAEDDRVVTYATLRSGTGHEARGMFVHSVANGQIARVWSVVRTA